VFHDPIKCRNHHRKLGVNQIDIRNAENEIPVDHRALVQHAIDDVQQRRLIF
jgi:hypothetical protein